MSTIVIVTGGFDPLHSGHIAYLNAARRLGDKLVVGLNSDAWLIRKKGYAFMPFSERQQVLGNLKSVDYTFDFDDSDDSACDAIEKMLSYFPFHDAVFANGGDRDAKNIPEMRLSGLHPARLKFAFGVGGTNKMNSSSNILANYEAYILRKNTSNGRREATETLQSYIDRRRPKTPFHGDATSVGLSGGPKIFTAGRNTTCIDDDPSLSYDERQGRGSF